MNSLPKLVLLVLATIFMIVQCSASTIPKGMPLELPKDATPLPLLRDPPTPPLFLPSDATTPPPPPLIFPEDVKNYNIVKNNATILAALTHQAEEVSDLLHSTDKIKEEIKNTEKKSETSTATSKVPTKKTEAILEKMQQSTTTIPSAPDVEAELIQPIHEERQRNEHEEQFNKHHHHKAQHEEAFLKHMRINDTTAIMAGSFAAVAVLGFAGLVMWRQMLEKKYGTRERLVTEDTYYTNNDLRHFEL